MVWDYSGDLVALHSCGHLFVEPCLARQPWRPRIEMVPGGLSDPPADAEEAKLTLEARRKNDPQTWKNMAVFFLRKIRGVATGIRDSGLGDGGIRVFFLKVCLIHVNEFDLGFWGCIY